MDWTYIGELTLSIVLLAPGIVIMALFVWWSVFRVTARVAAVVYPPLGVSDNSAEEFSVVPVQADTEPEA